MEGGLGLPPGGPAPVSCGGVEPGGGMELPLPGLPLGGPPPPGGTPPPEALEPAPPPPGCALPDGLVGSPAPDPLPPPPEPSGGPPPEVLGHVFRGVTASDRRLRWLLDYCCALMAEVAVALETGLDYFLEVLQSMVDSLCLISLLLMRGLS